MDRVSDWFTQSLIACSEDETVQHVIDAMTEHNISGLVVINEQNQPIGVVTAKDLVTRALATKLPLDSKVVKIMTAGGVHSVTTQDSIQHAAQIMADQRIKRLAVLDNKDNIIGIITISDVNNYCAKNKSSFSDILK